MYLYLNVLLSWSRTSVLYFWEKNLSTSADYLYVVSLIESI